MAVAEKFILSIAAVEVSYRKGAVFLDKCGSIMVRLESLLGAAFEGSIPQMVHGELANAAERILVRYGTKSFLVTQTWVQSPVRVEQLAPMAWEQVTEAMAVGREVTRFGARFSFMWATTSLEEAEKAIRECGLVSVAPSWSTSVGAPKTIGWSTTTESRQGGLTASVNATKTEIRGILSADLIDVVPASGVVLDLDFTMPGEAPFALQKGQMKDFTRNSWERAKVIAAGFRESVRKGGAQ